MGILILSVVMVRQGVVNPYSDILCKAKTFLDYFENNKLNFFIFLFKIIVFGSMEGFWRSFRVKKRKKRAGCITGPSDIGV